MGMSARTRRERQTTDACGGQQRSQSRATNRSIAVAEHRLLSFRTSALSRSGLCGFRPTRIGRARVLYGLFDKLLALPASGCFLPIKDQFGIHRYGELLVGEPLAFVHELDDPSDLAIGPTPQFVVAVLLVAFLGAGQDRGEERRFDRVQITWMLAEIVPRSRTNSIDVGSKLYGIDIDLKNAVLFQLVLDMPGKKTALAVYETGSSLDTEPRS